MFICPNPKPVREFENELSAGSQEIWSERESCGERSVHKKPLFRVLSDVIKPYTGMEQ